MNGRKFYIEVMLAWRNVWKNKRRTVLTLLTIMMGCSMIMFFRATQDGSYEAMIEDSIAANTGHIQVHEKGFWENMSISYAFRPEGPVVSYINSSPDVLASTKRVHAAGLASYGNNTFIAVVQGVDPEKEKLVSTLHETILPGGRYLAADDGKHIVIGATLAKNLGVKVGDTVAMISQGFDGSIAAANLAVVGIFKTLNPRYDQSMMVMPLATAIETFTMMDYISSIAVRLKSTADMERVRDELRALPEKQKLEIMGWDELTPELIQAIVMDKFSGYVFFLILLLITAFGVLNTVQMSVFERTREIGIMMAIGTRPGQIVRLVLFESIFISLIGVALGIILGASISYYFFIHPFDFSAYQKEMEVFAQVTTVFPAKLTWANVVVTSLLTFLFGVLFSILPARRASKLNPIKAIRQL
ncbi:MAG TPA: ABC transporter permease [Spirochaetota bacterium]|nr:ABC transporter permease [Spirochaetota bacterium]HOD15578.1 ABC transporter permease [Spirochaetota bacterium]HPG49129.1 ABC transporter permease [Spirochaetota bacterium]HPN13481.1 ABC transporter permease [Spirochaetota bacterium]